MLATSNSMSEADKTYDFPPFSILAFNVYAAKHPTLLKTVRLRGTSTYNRISVLFMGIPLSV